MAARLVMGGPRLLTETGADVPPQVASAVERWSREGRTVLYVLDGRSVLGAVAVEDEIRPESAEAVRAASQDGVARGDDHR